MTKVTTKTTTKAMTIKHHLDEATLLSYTAGSLTNAMALVVACHLSVCPKCREIAAEMEHVGSALLTSLPPSEMSMSALDKALSALDDNPIEEMILAAEQLETISLPSVEPAIPKPLELVIGDSLDDIEWKRLAPGISYVDLPTQGTGASKLLKIDPGKSVLPHTHTGNELTMILKGSYSDEIGQFSAGDIADLDDEVSHQPLVDSQEPCICIISTDAPLKFNTLIGRIVQPITGF